MSDLSPSLLSLSSSSDSEVRPSKSISEISPGFLNPKKSSSSSDSPKTWCNCCCSMTSRVDVGREIIHVKENPHRSFENICNYAHKLKSDWSILL